LRPIKAETGEEIPFARAGCPLVECMSDDRLV